MSKYKGLKTEMAGKQLITVSAESGGTLTTFSKM
jgi:hypothetical protein